MLGKAAGLAERIRLRVQRGPRAVGRTVKFDATAAREEALPFSTIPARVKVREVLAWHRDLENRGG